MPDEGIAIRRMRYSDLQSVMEIERDSFKMPWSEYCFSNVLKDSDSYAVVAESDGTVVGYAVSVICTDRIYIANLAVRNTRRRRGIGSRLLKVLLEHGHKLGKGKVSLTVRVSNRGAISLYERFGFRTRGIRKGYYSDGESALIMERPIFLEVTKPTAGKDEKKDHLRVSRSV